MILVRSLLISCLGVTVAVAQPADKTKTRVAKQYVDAGLAAQDTGDYDTAITFYQKAYDLVPHPVLLFNMAQAHRLAKREDKALEFYKQYLVADPDGPQSKTASEFVVEIEAKFAAKAEQTEDDVPKTKIIQLEQRKENGKPQASEQADASSIVPAQPREFEQQQQQQQEQSDNASVEHPGRTLRRTGVVLASVGIAGVGVGIGFGLRARQISEALSKPGAVYDPATVNKGESSNRIAIMGLVGGTVLAAVGVTLYWRGNVVRRRSDQLTLTPMLGDQSVGFALSGALP